MKSLKQKNHDLSLIPAESDLDSPLSHLNPTFSRLAKR